MPDNQENLKRELFFDLYGRYQNIYELIKKNHREFESEKILDVGGRGNILQRFFPSNDEFNIFYLDPYAPTNDNNYIEGDGCAIPLSDGSMDWVVSADVLEHIPEEKRELFVSENLRVAKKGVILVAPFFSRENVMADTNANNYFRELFNADHFWLKEHLSLGLPKQEKLENYLTTQGFEFSVTGNNNIKLWQLLLNLDFLKDYAPSNEMNQAMKNFNFFYNNFVFDHDFNGKSYRKIYLIKKQTNILAVERESKEIDETLTINIYKEYSKVINQFIKQIKISNDQLEIEKKQVGEIINNNLSRTIEEKERQAVLSQIQNQDLATKNEELLSAIENKDRQLNQQYSEIQEKRISLEKANKQIQTYQNALTDQKLLEIKMLEDFNTIQSQNKSLLQSIEAKDRMIKEQYSEICNKKQALDNLNTYLHQLEEKITGQEQEKQNIKTQIDNFSQQIDTITKQFHQRQDQFKITLAKKDQEILFMTSSKFWKLRTLEAKFKFGLFHPIKLINKYFPNLISKNKINTIVPTITLQAKEEKLSQPAKVIAFYLPQFHPIPENDHWWGKGFTEWTNVTKAKPQFDDHYQPHVPSDLGYYDLRLPEARQAQADLAKKYGIYGFCYYYYWFNGKKLLEQPLENMVASGAPNQKFCLCWANENWTRCWDGQDKEILISQDYHDNWEEQFILDTKHILRDFRYIRVNNKPLLAIYRLANIPDATGTVKRLRQYAKKHANLDLHICAVKCWNHQYTPQEFGIDAAIEFPPHGSIPTNEQKYFTQEFKGEIHEYDQFLERSKNTKPSNFPIYRTVMPSWDNTARRGENAHIFVNSSPKKFQTWLEDSIQYTKANYTEENRLIFVNAWNEWAEGCHLEPDQKYGHQYLQAVKNALENHK